MHHTFQSTPTWTFKSRTENVTKSNQPISSPGPCDYIANKSTHKPPTLAHTKQQRNLYSKFVDVPGPGQYQSKTAFKDGKKYSLSQKLISKPNQNPGPSQYQNDTIVVKKKNPSFTISTRSKSYGQLMHEKNLYKPPPVSYEAAQTFLYKNKKSTFIGTSSRKPLDQNEKTPAPNTYDIERASKSASMTNPHYILGKDKLKNFTQNPQLSPGPAVYNATSFVQANKSHSKGFSCRKKVNDLEAMEIHKVPGPGAYQQHLNNKAKAPAFTPGRQNRSTFIDKKQKHQKEYPGPGQHQNSFSSSKYRSTSCYNFSKSKRKSLYENQVTPSPIEYKNQQTSVQGSAPKFSFGHQVERHKNPYEKIINPGPGQYDPLNKLVKSSSQNFSVPHELRPDFQNQRKYPGPGYYNLRGKQQGPQWKFSNDKRLAFTDNKNEAKHGKMYQTSSSFPNPPKYMNVQSKLVYSGRAK